MAPLCSAPGSARWVDGGRHLVDLLHLVETELHRNLALEDVHEDLELLGVRLDVDDLAVEVRERPGGYLHRLAEGELHLGTRPFADRGARAEDAVDLRLRERDRLAGGADEPRHARRVFDDAPGVVVEVHVHEDVAREDALLGLHLLAVLRLDHLLGRDDDAAEAWALVHRVDPVLEVGLHLVLVAGVRVDDVPAEHQRIASTTRCQSRSFSQRYAPVIAQAMITTTEPVVTWRWSGHSTLRSSATDSRTNEPR